MPHALRNGASELVEDEPAVQELEYLQAQVRQLGLQLDQVEAEFWRVLHGMGRDGCGPADTSIRTNG